jgi:2-isopropylmalate synthase
VTKLREDVPDATLAIHPHNDGDVAVANALAGIMAGATQVQGTINGIGERCGNANLVSVIADLKMKMGIDCVTDEQLGSLAEVSHFVSEIVNRTPNPYQPYVGSSAFTHKAGLHASAVAKVAESYQHIAPERVGNVNHVLVSELAGRSNVLQKLEEMGIPASPEVVQNALELIKQQENRGFQYEGAEASFEMLVRRALPGYQAPFELVDFMVIVEKHRRPTEITDEGVACEATVKIQVDGQVKHTAAGGNGPVNAMDVAARKALMEFYPAVEVIRLLDYKVRVVDQGTGTEAMVRVLIDSTDGDKTWHTVGCSANIIEASWMALQDSLEWWLLGRQQS